MQVCLCPQKQLSVHRSSISCGTEIIGHSPHKCQAMQSGVNKKMVDKKTENYTFKSYVCGYHVYQKILRPVTEECIVRRREPENLEDKNAVAVVKDGFEVGHVPKCFSLWMSMFLRLPKTSINCKITVNRVNRGAGNGLKIPCEYSADGDRQAVDWLKRKISCGKILVESLINIRELK